MKLKESLRLSPEEDKDNKLRGPRPYPFAYLEIPEGITAIDAEVFKGNNHVEVLVLPASLRRIGRQVFSGCGRLAAIVGGEHVTQIGDEAFSGCARLREPLLPEGLTRLGARAYAGCMAMDKAVVPKSVRQIGEQPFFRCALKSWSLPRHLLNGDGHGEKVLGIPDEDGFIISEGVLELYRGRRRSVRVPDGVHTIRAGAFDESRVPAGGLEIQLPGSLRTLERSAAFQNSSVKVSLPPYYLRQPRPIPASATVELLEGAWRNEVLAADIVSLYLFQRGTLLSKAAVLLEERDPVQMVKLMQQRIEQGDLTPRRLRNARARLAEFCFAHSADLAPDWQGMFPPEQPPALLVLEANQVDPVSAAVSRIRASGGEEAADPRNVKTAIAGYLAAGQHSKRTGKAPFLVPEAEAGAALLDRSSLTAALSALLPERDGKDSAQVYPFLRFATGDQAAPYLAVLRLPDPQRTRGRRQEALSLPLPGPLLLNDSDETLLEMVRAERSHPGEGFLGLYLRTLAPQQEHRTLCFPAALGLDAAGSKEYCGPDGEPLVRLSFDDGAFVLTNLKTGRRCKNLPNMPDAIGQRVEISQDIAAIRDYYADLTAWVRSQQLDSFLLGEETPYNMWLQISRDPFLRREATGIVWEQDGRTFVWDGQFARSSRGRRLRLREDRPVRAAHPRDMTAADLAGWKAWFSRRPAPAGFHQLEEPVYAASEIRPDRYQDCYIELWDLQKAEPQLQFEESLRRRHNALAIGGGGTLEVTAPASVRGSARLALGKLSLETLDRCANHAIYLLDCWTMRQRVARDDLSILKALETLPREQLPPLLDLAVQSEAPQLTAALLEYTNAKPAAPDTEEFTLDG